MPGGLLAVGFSPPSKSPSLHFSINIHHSSSHTLLIQKDFASSLLFPHPSFKATTFRSSTFSVPPSADLTSIPLCCSRRKQPLHCPATKHRPQASSSSLSNHSSTCITTTMSGYYYQPQHHQPSASSSYSSSSSHNHHTGRSRRAPRLSGSQNSQRQFRGVRSMKELTESQPVSASRARFEAGRSFDLDDDLEFCPGLLTEDDVSNHGAVDIAITPQTESLFVEQLLTIVC